MLLWPRLYYPHYGAFDAPFLALASALPASRLATRAQAARRSGPSRDPARPTMLPTTAAAATVLLIIGLGYRQLRAEVPLRGVQVSAAADRLIPAGACVVSNGAAFTVAADRFYSDVPGCPAVVDPLGTMIALTSGRYLDDTPAQLRPAVALWQTALDRAQYVWLTSGTFQEIPWNRSLNGYFTRRFRLIGLARRPHRRPLRSGGRPLRPHLAAAGPAPSPPSPPHRPHHHHAPQAGRTDGSPWGLRVAESPQPHTLTPTAQKRRRNCTQCLSGEQETRMTAAETGRSYRIKLL